MEKTRERVIERKNLESKTGMKKEIISYNSKGKKGRKARKKERKYVT